MPDGFPKPVIEFIAIDNDLLRMDGFDSAERDGEVTGILDVDDQLLPAVWRDLADSSKGSASETKISKPSWICSLAIAVSYALGH